MWGEDPGFRVVRVPPLLAALHVVKVRGASGRALGRGGCIEPFTLTAQNPDLASDPLLIYN